ncbi:MAG: hypothetical protein MJY54_03090, partial [archaeon]|nr:hypothetical protein [archaeon]
IDDSIQTIRISAGEQIDFTYNYIANNIKNAKYGVSINDALISSVADLNKESTFYIVRDSYTPLTITLISVIIFLAVLFIYLCNIKKPGRNKRKR